MKTFLKNLGYWLLLVGGIFIAGTIIVGLPAVLFMKYLNLSPLWIWGSEILILIVCASISDTIKSKKRR